MILHDELIKAQIHILECLLVSATKSQERKIKAEIHNLKRELVCIKLR